MWPPHRVLADPEAAIGIALAAAVAALGIVGAVGDDIVLSTVLAVLALLLASLLRVRSDMAASLELRESEAALLKRVDDALTGNLTASALLQDDYPELGPGIQDATEISVVAGVSLKTTVGRFYGEFAKALEAGTRLRFICPDPKDLVLMDIAAFTSLNRIDGSEASLDVQANIDFARHLSTTPGASGTVEVRTIRCLPSNGLVHFRGCSSGNHIWVKLLPFYSAPTEYPAFLVSSERDPDLYRILAKSVERLWAHGNEVAPKQS